MEVSWIVETSDEFEPEFYALHEDVRTEILALTRLLQRFRPPLGRPRVDTLNGSSHSNYEGNCDSARPMANGESHLSRLKKEKS